MTNTTFKSAPWADALFAMDLCWWDVYRKEVSALFKGMLFSSCKGAIEKHGLSRIVVDGKMIQPFGNSGAGAIVLSALAGASRVILAGYDCQHTGGMAHHHGDHPKKLGNAVRPDAWINNFELCAKHVSGVDIVNASRETAIKCWPRMAIEDALCTR